MASAWMLGFVSDEVKAVARFPPEEEMEWRYWAYALGELRAATRAKARWLALPPGDAERDVGELLNELIDAATTDRGPHVHLSASISGLALRPSALPAAAGLGDRLIDAMQAAGLETLSMHPLSEALPHVRLFSPRVYKQVSNGFCGYYALSNLMLVFQALMQGADSPDGLQTLAQLANGPFFWARRQDMLRALMARLRELEAQDEAFFPWDKENILTSSMERNFAEYLVEGIVENAGSLLAANNCQLLYIADCAALRKGHESLHALQHYEAVFERLRTSPRFVLGLLVGLATHWISLVIVKTPAGIDVVVMDSLNAGILDLQDTHIWENIIVSMCRERFAHKKRDEPADWLLYAQMLVDCREIAVFLARVCSGDLDLRKAWLVGGVTSVLVSFRERVYSGFDAMGLVEVSRRSTAFVEGGLVEPVDDILMRFEAWLNDQFPPKHIEFLMLERVHAAGSIAGIGNMQTESGLRCWMAFVAALRGQESYRTLAASSPALQRFESTWKKLQSVCSR
eukprot:c16307_g1_i1.p1 GENE.c16307_g1_i1~~c16307_g1_i1.p1  ORF type:complete len:542 (+),score=99.62 c16307_g1_i1:86-1627(+)